MAKFVRQTSDVAMALDRIQGFAENLMAAETNRRIQLGREKEARMVDAYSYMLREEESQITELETALDAITTSLNDRGVDMLSLPAEQRTIAGPDILSAATEGAMEMVQSRVDAAKDYKSRLEEKKRNALKIKRHIDLYDDAYALIDPSYAGDKKVIGADDVAVVREKLLEGLDDELKKEVLESKAYLKQREEYLQRPAALEAISESYKADHVSAIQAYEIPRQHAVDVVKMRTQDPAMVLSRHYRSIGALQAKLDEETVPNKQEALKTEIQTEYADLGSLLFPQIKDYEGNWITPTPELSANMAQELSESLLLLQKEGDPTEFVAYLENVQLYYDEIKRDDSEQGRMISDRVRGEVLTLLGIDLEAPIQFGDEFLTDIELILRAYNEVERIDLEQLFHGELLEGAIPSNVTFDALEPDTTASKADIFGKAKLKQ